MIKLNNNSWYGLDKNGILLHYTHNEMLKLKRYESDYEYVKNGYHCVLNGLDFVRGKFAINEANKRNLSFLRKKLIEKRIQ